MGVRERQVQEYRAVRDAAHDVFRADLDLVRANLSPKALVGRAGEKAGELSEAAAETAQRHRVAVIGGGVAALAGGALYWLGKDRIVAAFHAVRNRFRNTPGGEEFDLDNPDPEEQEQTP